MTRERTAIEWRSFARQQAELIAQLAELIAQGSHIVHLAALYGDTDDWTLRNEVMRLDDQARAWNLL